MKITRENIEELMFDYFEGHLSDHEKSAFLNYLHLHPELEKDFTQWAQTYAHVEERVPDYGLAAKLVRSAPLAWYAKGYWLGGSALCLVGLGLWLYLGRIGKEEKVSENQLPSSLPSHSTISVTPSSSCLISTTEQKTASTSKSEEWKKSRQMVVDTNSEEQRLAPKTLPDFDSLQTVQPMEMKAETQEHPKEAVPKGIDTVIHSKTASPVLPMETKKKNSKRSPMNLKPSEKFLPVNPNF